ncbi:MAG: dTDP-glucose 4,6-dehydratase [Candidatus Firestonebacteria bacterium]
MRILVTGGAGFIGSNFIRYILKKYSNYCIINLDKLTYAGNLDNLKNLEKNSRYKFVKGDICNFNTVEKVMKNCDAVVNFAAETHVDRSISDPSSFIKTNFHGVYILLEVAKKNNIKKFLQISTDEVYGSILSGSFKENDNLAPSSPYSASKASADLLAMSYYATFKLSVLITRSSNNFGPYQFPEKVMPLFITNALMNKNLPVYGTGKNIRDWIYVEDNCAGLDLVLHKGKTGEIYNIGGENEKTNLEITNLILKYLDKPKSLITFIKDRLGHDFRYSINCNKVKRLGFKSKYNFETALKQTIKWYLNNKWWWTKLI